MSTKKLQIIGNLMKVDETLAQAGQAADAKATGDKINQLQTSIDEVAVSIENLNDKYYTESEINDKFNVIQASIDSKPDADHIHADLYYTKDEVSEILDSHNSNTENPHGVTKDQIGLGNVDNTSDANKPISDATQAALDGKADSDHTHDAYADIEHAHSYSEILDAPSTVDIYIQEEEPADTPDGVLWVDLDADSGDESYVETQVLIDTTLTQAGQAADAKAVGDAIGDIGAVLDAINGEVI